MSRGKRLIGIIPQATAYGQKNHLCSNYVDGQRVKVLGVRVEHS